MFSTSSILILGFTFISNLFWLCCMAKDGITKLSILARAYNPRTLRGRGRHVSVNSRPGWSTKWVQDNQGYTGKPCLKRNKTKQKMGLLVLITCGCDKVLWQSNIREVLHPCMARVLELWQGLKKEWTDTQVHWPRKAGIWRSLVALIEKLWKLSMRIVYIWTVRWGYYTKLKRTQV